MVEWFLAYGTRNVIVIDNQSTYPPLLKYYAEMASRIDVRVQDSNLGPWGFWHAKAYHAQLPTPYMVTDADLSPGFCPADVVQTMLEVLNETGIKVGPSLRIDNLPEHYSKKNQVAQWESQFWRDRYAASFPCWRAEIDTTLAMYPAFGNFRAKALRLDAPYSFEHAPWYVDESIPNEEDTFYRKHYDSDVCAGAVGWSMRPELGIA